MKLSFDITVTDEKTNFVSTFIRLARGLTIESKGIGLVQITATWEDTEESPKAVDVSLIRSLLLYALQSQEAVVRISTIRTG